MNYYIKDWAGSRMFENKTFENSEDAFNFLLQKFPKEEDLQEYYIVNFKDGLPDGEYLRVNIEL
tara:strand:- start:1280 stop:1471 length:192 start_codon:yes stop_codon:yes gene_type:complete